MKNRKTEATAVVLAAGEGKRMQPLGASIPKVMLPILGKPALHYIITNLIDAAVEKIILIVSPTSSVPVKKYFGNLFKGIKIDYVIQKEQLGPAQAISLALPKIETPYFLVQYGDSLTGTNVSKKVIETLRENPHTNGILAVRLVDNPSQYGIVKYQNGKIIEVIEKPTHPQSNYAVVGTYILKTDSFKKAIEGVKFEYRKELFPAQYILARGGKLASFLYEGRRVDLGKPEDLFNAGQLLAKKPTRCIAFDADNTLYNTHQVSKFADIDAFGVIAKRVGIAPEKIYERWIKIVEKVRESKIPQLRTRLYSYGVLLKQLSADENFLKLIYNEFVKSLTKRLKPIISSQILTSLDQPKVVITEDIKSLVLAKLRSTHLNKNFEEIITSDDTKVMKPSRKFYSKLLAKYDSQEILVVGDDWEKDLRIPSELGMQVMFIKEEEDLKQLLKLGVRPITGVQPLKVHIMGIAGAGAAAVAGIAQKYGYQVSGCDISPNSPYVKNLKIEIASSHSPYHLSEVDMLVISPAVEKLNPENSEIQSARKLKIPIVTWQKFQGDFLQKDRLLITVAGAYGKSTTTAMIAKVLTDLDLDPTCEIGAKLLDWNANFRAGKSKYYVCESDEYNNNFLNYHPDIAVVLNVSWDHPDFFKTEQELFASYQKFVGNIKKNGILIISKDKKLRQLAKGARGDIKVVELKDFGKVNLKIIGEFRQQNAQSALTVAQVLGLDIKRAKESLEGFSGIGRRLEYKGQMKDVKFYDDYAVQPYTILKTADALKEKFKDKKILLVLEPHTFSRIESFFGDFVASLQKTKVDQIYITNVYAAREKGNNVQLSKKLADTVGPRAKYTGSIEQTARYIKNHSGDWNIICSMGAGDSYKLFDLTK